MAKRGVLEHEKNLALADALEIPECFSLGVLEAFWHWVAKYRPHGDITGIKASLFARSIRYAGDPQLLLQSLINCGWIDKAEDGRLLVHDWSEHADNAVRFDLIRKHERFADGKRAKPNQHLRIQGSTKRSRRRDRIDVAGGEVPKPLRELVLHRDHWACRECGSHDDLTIDHVRPVSRGGITHVLNLQTLCRTCNGRKRDQLQEAAYGA